MALTLTEGEKYSQDELTKAVIDRLTKDSAVLRMLPFVAILGNALTYNTITTDSSATTYAVGDTWDESTPALTAATATLKIVGGDADVDNFLKATRSNIIDLTGTVIENKTKAVQYKFMDNFYYGDASANAKDWNGLHLLMSSTTYNTVHAGSGTGTALAVSKLRQAIDLFRGFSPDGIFMTRAMRRGLSVYLDSIGDKFPRDKDQWGKSVEVWDGIPIYVDDHITDTETASSGAYAAKTTGANTSIFILNFGEQSTCGVHSGDGVTVVPLGDLETKDASRTRIKWYAAQMFQDLRSSAKVDGIVSAGTVTA